MHRLNVTAMRLCSVIFYFRCQRIFFFQVSCTLRRAGSESSSILVFEIPVNNDFFCFVNIATGFYEHLQSLSDMNAEYLQMMIFLLGVEISRFFFDFFQFERQFKNGFNTFLSKFSFICVKRITPSNVLVPCEMKSRIRMVWKRVGTEVEPLH